MSLIRVYNVKGNLQQAVPSEQIVHIRASGSDECYAYLKDVGGDPVLFSCSAADMAKAIQIAAEENAGNGHTVDIGRDG